MVLIVPLIFELFFDWWNLMKKKIWNRWWNCSCGRNVFVALDRRCSHDLIWKSYDLSGKIYDALYAYGGCGLCNI